MNTPSGAFVGSYEKSGKRARRLVFIWAIIFLIGLACIFMLSSRPPQVPGVFNKSEDDLQGMLALGAIIAAGCGGLALWYTGYLGYIRPEETFEVLQDGFIMHRKSGDECYQWSELRAYTHAVTRHYTNGIHTGDSRAFTLAMDDGKKFVLNNNFKGIKELEEVLPKMTLGPLMKRVAAALNAGQTLSFGSIAITPNGLYNGKEALVWDDVAGLNVARGTITIFARDPNGKKPRKYATTRFTTLPNAYAFLETIYRLAPALQKK